jgi:cob(I)alamin adenosyltransferase
MTSCPGPNRVKFYYPSQEKRRDQKGRGLIHVCYGRGPGKTTRAVGLAVRASGAALHVHFVQFMKAGDSGEVDVLKRLPGIHYYCPGPHPFITPAGPGAVHLEHAAKALAYSHEAIDRGAHVLVCDEILNTLIFGVLAPESVTGLMERCRGVVELVMTGSDAPDDIIRAADYATEFIQKKHPYYEGVQARPGIEL